MIAYIKINSPLVSIKRPEIKEKIIIFFLFRDSIKLNRSKINNNDRKICKVIEEVWPAE